MKILIAYGTRPEYLKIKPLIEQFKLSDIAYVVVFTGQHDERIGINFDYDHKIAIDNGENRLDSIVASLMNQMDFFIKLENVTHILVQGDTTSAIAMALSAFHHGLKVIHLEAGLRTYDRQNPYPEEINRRIISQIADIHLCPTAFNAKNLYEEHVNVKSIHVVGNTVIDNLISYKEKCTYEDKILVTLHRRENHANMDEWFITLNELAKEHPELAFIFPMHPNPNVQKHKHLLTDVAIINPLSYEKMLDLLVQVKLVITDSGGLQEECSFFNKKCLVCRKVSERPEVIGKSSIMIDNPKTLKEIFNTHIRFYKINYDCPYGDGQTAQRIVNILKKYE